MIDKCKIVINSDKIKLRPIVQQDLSITLTWRNNSEIRRWFKTNKPLTFTQHLNWFSQYQRKEDDIVFIVLKKDTKELIGQVSVYNIISSSSAEVGRFIADRKFQGQGFLKEAIVTLISWAFQVFFLKKIYLEVFSANKNAIELYERIGFICIDSKMHDKIVKMELLCSDFFEKL